MSELGSYIKLIKKLKNDGWIVELIYLYLPFVELSINRVAERVKHGGHNIPLQTILRRYPRSINNLINHYAKLCDTVTCIDNSNQNQEIIFSQNFENRIVTNQKLFNKLLKSVPND